MPNRDSKRQLHIQDEAVIASALGKKVQFRNLNHASRTIQQLRHHSDLQQMLQEKYRLSKIAGALDQQVHSANISDWQTEEKL